MRTWRLLLGVGVGVGLLSVGLWSARPVQAEEPAKPAAKPTAPNKAAAKPKCKAGMVGIPTGTFTMGPDPENTDRPARQVSADAFCMDRTEVTISAYATCVKTGKCTPALVKRGGLCNVGVTERGNHPINCVDWNEATAYCAALGQRLPTEEEWEYAARGTDGRLFPWGNAEPASQLCWYRSDEYPTNPIYYGERIIYRGEPRPNSTCAVASFPAGNSPFGLSDMSGNVWEWTSSAYSAGSADRVTRGGGWLHGDPSRVRSAYRLPAPPSAEGVSLGFRCAGSPLP